MNSCKLVQFATAVYQCREAKLPQRPAEPNASGIMASNVLVLNAMDEVLLADRFAAAIAAESVVSCAVPLPPTMPKVKHSKNGLPIPVRLESERPLFANTMRRPASAPARALKRMQPYQRTDPHKAMAEVHDEQTAELAELTKAILELRSEYNRLLMTSAVREERLESLQILATLGERDSYDVDDELAYMRGMRAAMQAEVARVSRR